MLTSQPGNYTADLPLEGLSHLRSNLERAEYLQNLLISQATGGSASDAEYKELRQYFFSMKVHEADLPDFVRTSRDLSQFWNFIKYKFGTYAERREFIWASFAKFLARLEGNGSNVVSSAISTSLDLKFGANSVHLEIQKALERVENDPEGAITLARTVLESVCKLIADERGIKYSDSDDLSVMFKAIAKELNLSPDQHTEDIFKQVLGACSAIVNGLGTLRNRLGDAHGKGQRQARVKPSSRHAELAANLAGSMAIFLIDTHKAKRVAP